MDKEMSPHLPVSDAAGGARGRRDFMVDSMCGLVAAGAATVANASMALAKTTSNDRYERGIALLQRLGGPDYDGPIKRLAQVSPDLARFTVEFPYGDILCRPGLDLRLRQVTTVSSLIAQGSAQPQLKYHMNGFLNIGGQPRELVELMFVAIAMLGFSSSINAVGVLREIFKERNITFDPIPAATDDGTRRYAKGMQALADIFGDPARYLQGLGAVSPELAKWTVEFEFGEALSRDGLDARARQIAIISMLATVGNRTDLLRAHIDAGLKAGLSRTEISEALMQLSVYAGFPAALNAFGVANSVPSGTALPTAQVAPAGGALAVVASEGNDARMDRGLTVLGRTSAAAGQAVVNSFNDLAPEIGRDIVKHAYGDIFSRPRLESKTRELLACSALAAVGSTTMEMPLRVHANAALNAGATEAEVVEALLNLIPYCGYPVVQRAMRIVGEVFAKRPA